MMDIEKLIEQLKYYGTTYAIGDNLGKEIDGSDELMLDAATALSTLQAENEKLRAELNDLKDEWDKYQPREHWETLNELCENLRDELDEKEKYYDQMIDALSATDSAELEQVKRCIEIVEHQRDAAIRDLKMVAVCDTCVHEHEPSCPGCNDAENWQWRGPQKED